MEASASAWVFIEQWRDDEEKHGLITGQICDQAERVLCGIVEDVAAGGVVFGAELMDSDGCLDPATSTPVDLPDGSQYLDIDLTIPAPT